jgi:GntR family transcriptional regulator, trigonelline degradation regulator
VNHKTFNIDRQAAPIRTQTIQKLREAILDDYFKPGERLYEKELCEQFGVSRTTVREALRQLEAEGLVGMVPNQGPVVTRVLLDEAEDIYQIRELLECLACRLFAERATDEQVLELTGTVADLEKASDAGDVGQYLAVKNAVYEILFSRCGNLVAYSLFKSLFARVNFLRKTSLSRPGRTQDSVAEIQAIVKAIQERDPQAAHDRCLEHVRKASAIALDGLRREFASQVTGNFVEEDDGKQPV